MKVRNQNIQKLKTDTLDVLIIGGGMNGAVSAAALASRGAKVGLIDSRDYAGFTSQTSSNLKVEDILGTTAASLGLGGINVAASVADGQFVGWLVGRMGAALIGQHRLRSIAVADTAGDQATEGRVLLPAGVVASRLQYPALRRRTRLTCGQIHPGEMGQYFLPLV